MARVQTWAEFLADLKTEAGIQVANVTEDAFLLALANEALTQITSMGDDLRDFRVDVTLTLASTTQLVTNVAAFAKIDQVYYQQMDGTIIEMRWDLAEQSGRVGPSPMPNRPNAYTVSATVDPGDPNLIQSTFKFYPIASARIGDKIQIVGTGFEFITDINTRMSYPTLYPWLKASILERYAIRRNLDPEKVKLITALVDRAGGTAIAGTRDNGNTENTPNAPH